MKNNKMGGKVVLVTGATDGIGKVAALELARMGATVVLVGRNPEKMERVLAEFRQDLGPEAKVDSIIGNLSLMAEVRQVAATFLSRYDRLDVLVNNAGGFFAQRQETTEGYEMTFALNHLNYFLLTELLLPVIQKSKPARIINVSSGAHFGQKLNFDDLQRRKSYSGWRVYGESKLMNILFTRALARRLEGSGVTVNVLHPGFVATRFGHGNGLMDFFIRMSQKLFAISPQEGAKTTIFLASSPEVEGITGKYFYKSQVQSPSPAAQDDEVAERLWQISEEIVKQAA